jgi:uncharacterized protein (DUF1810 family)
VAAVTKHVAHRRWQGTRHHGRMTDRFQLQRFVDAQDADGTYTGALRELRNGAKLGHWMWFVFPQVAGLGRSSRAAFFAISGLDEAAAYLAHPVLGPRLLDCARALTGLPETDAVKVLGDIDAQKLQSSMTLFGRAAEQDHVFQDVLDQYFAGELDHGTTSRLWTDPLS